MNAFTGLFFVGSGKLPAMPKPNQHHIAALSLPLPSVGGEVQIFPAGSFDAPDGALEGAGPWFIDSQIAAAVIARAGRSRQQDMLIDYEHQSLLAAENGRPAPAAGWQPRAGLVWREGEGLFGTGTRWTAAAKTAIDGDEYRYISPVFNYDDAGRVTGLISLALTNKPAIPDMRRAAASFKIKTREESTMDDLSDDLRAALCAALGLAAAATSADITAELARVGEKRAALGAGLTLSAALDKQAESLAAASAAAPDPAKFVAASLFNDLSREVNELKSAAARKEADGQIAAASAAGRLVTAAQTAHARSLGGMDADGKPLAAAAPNLAALTAYLGTLEPVAALAGGPQGRNTPPPGPAADPGAEWEASAALKAEFSSKESYVAYCSAASRGLIKANGGN